MIANYGVDVSELIKFTNSGVEIANYVQIRESVINKYKEVYGSDIDLSTGSADGVFVSNLSLMINNILQSIKTMYANLNVNTATGVYLDNLCALSNITRKPATYSVAELTITNEGSSEIDLSQLTFVDKSGIEWYSNSSGILQPNNTIAISVICSKLGPVSASIGWIYDTINLSSLIVEQTKAAIEGLSEETDAELRARRARSTGANGLTVLGALEGSLLNISGIRDVKIYNNNSSVNKSSEDGTVLPPHSIYVIIRHENSISDYSNNPSLLEQIGTTINNKLTPGIPTTKMTVGIDSVNAVSGEYTVNLIEGFEDFNTKVYWKRSLGISPQFSITITKLPNYNSNYESEIANKIMNYMNNLPISNIPRDTDLIFEMMNADPTFQGRLTYFVKDVDITDIINMESDLKDNHFDYTEITYQKEENDVTFTFEGNR